MKYNFDAIIIGGGAVGCAVAYELSRYDLSIALLERNPDVCMGTSGKNSAVVHAGFNNRPGSLMAELCVKGNKHFEEYCRNLDVPYRKTGKFVVALNESDLPVIDGILETGEKNGCAGLKKIDKQELSIEEPNVRGIAALSSGNTAVFNPFLYVYHLAYCAIENGVKFFLNSEVVSIKCKKGKYEVCSEEDVFTCSILVNSAGLYSDKTAAMAGDTKYKIYPNRGEYFILDKLAPALLRRPVYPVPRKGIGGLGVHLTVTIDNNILIGPSAEYAGDAEQYASTQKMMDNLINEAQMLVPDIKRNMIIGAFTGMRAKTVPPGSDNFGDFIIEESAVAKNMINLIGIESPGITASIPIAERVCEILSVHNRLKQRTDWKGVYKANPVFRELDIYEQKNLICKNPDYGEVICRCENITKAEVMQALGNPLGVKTLVGLKNRVRTMMGRCQGGYCLTNIVEIMTNELDIKPQDIIYRKNGDMPFMGRCP